MGYKNMIYFFKVWLIYEKIIVQIESANYLKMLTKELSTRTE